MSLWGISTKVLYRCIELYLKTLKTKYEDQQVTKLQRKLSNRKVSLNQIGLKETRQNNKLLQWKAVADKNMSMHMYVLITKLCISNCKNVIYYWSSCMFMCRRVIDTVADLTGHHIDGLWQWIVLLPGCLTHSALQRLPEGEAGTGCVQGLMGCFLHVSNSRHV